MSSAKEVRQWIEWDRANPSPLGQYLVVTEIGALDLPWAEAASEHFYNESAERERTLAAFAQELVRDPADVNARFVALDFFHLARAAAEADAQLGVPEPDFWNPRKGEVPQVRAHFRKELGSLLELLKVEECPADPKFIEWEILNSCLVGDLDRVLKLLTRAEEEKLFDRALAQAFRGQYRFVAALEGTAELESQDWRPRLYEFPREQDQKDMVTGLRLLLLGIVTRDTRLARDPYQIELLRDAAHDLEKAASGIADAPPAYRAALAGSYFSGGKFREAADQYRLLLGVNLKLGEKVDLHKAVYESLVLAHERAGNLAGAMQALQDEIAEYHHERGLWLRMAELKSREGHHDEVAECVRKELEIAPDADVDWRLSTVLTLAATQGSLEELKRVVPQLCEGIRSGLERFWPPFRSLNREAADACLEGEVNAALSRHPEIFPAKYEKDAARDWAAAVEVELRERLFCSFRFETGQRDGLRTIAEKSTAKGSKTEIFCRFLLGRGKLGLGQMHRVLCECNSAAPGEGIFHELQQWLRAEHPEFDIRQAAKVLQEINGFRNPATHREKGSRSAEETMRLCRNFLEAINSTF